MTELFEDLPKIYEGMALNEISNSSIPYKLFESISFYYLFYSYLSLFTKPICSYYIIIFSSGFIITVSSINSSGCVIIYLCSNISKGSIKSNNNLLL